MRLESIFLIYVLGALSPHCAITTAFKSLDHFYILCMEFHYRIFFFHLTLNDVTQRILRTATHHTIAYFVYEFIIDIMAHHKRYAKKVTMCNIYNKLIRSAHKLNESEWWAEICTSFNIIDKANNVCCDKMRKKRSQHFFSFSI